MGCRESEDTLYYQDYDEYLASPEWRARSLRRAEIDSYRCQMCGCEGTMVNKLQCHHLTYRNLYHEDVATDLVTVCDICHRGIHRLMSRVTDPVTMRRGWRDTLPPSQHHVIDIDGKGGRLEIVADNKSESNP